MIYGIKDGVKIWSCERSGRNPGKFITKDFKDEIKQEWYYTNIANYTRHETLLRIFRNMTKESGIRLITKNQYNKGKLL